MKKGKLLLSLSLMCLSIAVLCFGVFAAASVSYSISGTISYTVNDAFVKVNTVVYKGTNQYTTNEALETLATNLASGTPTVSASGFEKDTSFSIPEYDSTNSESFSKTSVALTLSSTIKSYLVEMTITNLSPSVNVWAKANWTPTDDSNIVQGNNEYQTEINSTASKKICFIVSIADMTQSVTDATYKMGLEIGINGMPIEATVDGTTIQATYGMTWNNFIQNNSDYSTTQQDSNDYVTKNSKKLKLNDNYILASDTIYESATYELEKTIISFSVRMKQTYTDVMSGEVKTGEEVTSHETYEGDAWEEYLNRYGGYDQVTTSIHIVDDYIYYGSHTMKIKKTEVIVSGKEYSVEFTGLVWE